MFLVRSAAGALFRFRFNPMTTRKLGRIVSNYYRAQGGTRLKKPAIVSHPVPGIAFDITLVVIFVLLGAAYMF